MASGAVPSLALHNSTKIPIIGLGVWRAEKNEVGKVVKDAIKAGYRHFDCAADYGNEAEVGQALAEAISEGLVEREDLFITTKLWNSDHGHVREACENSLKNLGLKYVDLYLVHFPLATKHTGLQVGGIQKDSDGVMIFDHTVSLEQTWRGMEALVEAGLVKNIGISNYPLICVADILAYAKIKPVTNQIETHPYFQRDDLVKFCTKNGISITAHTPLGGGAAKTALNDSVIKEIADKYGKTPAQVLLRWGVQRNTIIIPKSVKDERLKENIAIFDFELGSDDIAKIQSIDKNYRSNHPAGSWGVDIYA